jgi:very-short-patch-repair endonuclease
LKGKQVEGRRFKRQHSVGKYILDFYCPSERLAVEVDGDVHASSAQAEHDSLRTEFLKGYNIRVIRFDNDDVFYDPEGVIQEIKSSFSNPLAR